jgi:tetratricopeptide (TPR) repeat protein
MPNLKPDQIASLVDLLRTLISTEADRRALIISAFGNEAADRLDLNYTGTERTFCVNLIARLDAFGEVEFGKPALAVLLDSIRPDVGVEKHEQIDNLIAAISGFAPPKERKLTTSSDDRLTTYRIPMIGRDTDLQAALDVLKAAPLFVVGVGGLGKSRLAYAAWEQGEFTGCIWLRLTDTTPAEEILVLLRQHYDLPTQIAPDAIFKRVRMDSGLLVALDNAESVPQAARRGFVEMIARLRTAGAAVLITSREEWREVNRPRRLQPSQLSPESAAGVVTTMAREFNIEADITLHAAELAKAARYHPRLIELAVGKLDYLRADQVIAELRDLKSSDMQDALTEMIRKTLDQMDERDGGAARALLRRLAVCAGAFDYDAAKAIGGLDDDALQAALQTLRDFRFVRFDGSRYQIDELVKLGAGAEETAQQAHFGYYRALARRIGGDNARHDRYQLMDAERDEFEAAFNWALTHDPENAYWLANGCLFYFANRGRWNQLMDWFTRLEAALRGQGESHTWAALQNSLGILYQEHPYGSRRDNLKRAIDAYREALRFYTPDAAPLAYAMTQNNLGTAYRDLAAVEARVDNLKRAIDAFREALRFRTPDAAPLDYAATQNNLGIAYSNLEAVEDRTDNLKRAIDAFREALRFRTPDAAPLAYAMTQNNLGTAYRDLAAVEDRTDNLKRAIDAYREALRFRTLDAAPLDYAMTHNNLGIAYRDLAAVEDRTDNLKRAIDAYREALRFYTPDAAPLDYAMTHNNLGTAYRDLAAVEDRTDNLKRAIDAYREALRFYTPDAAPLDYAATQNNLGIAYSNLAAVEARVDNLKRAIDAYREALRFYTPDAAPLDYAMTHNNLGTAYSDLAAVEDRADNLKRAIDAFREALRFRTPDAAPLEYAATHNNLGIAYSNLAAVEDRADNLKRAIDAFREALRFRTPDAAPLDYAQTQANLGIALEDTGDLRGAVACWREAERYYRQMDAIEAANLMLRWIERAEQRLRDEDTSSK